MSTLTAPPLTGVDALCVVFQALLDTYAVDRAFEARMALGRAGHEQLRVPMFRLVAGLEDDLNARLADLGVDRGKSSEWIRVCTQIERGGVTRW